MAGNNESLETYYSILQSSRNATYDELKRNYQYLIKEYHPDKNREGLDTEDLCIKIDKAWKILRDEQSRKEYDASLLQKEISDNALIYAELSKDEFIFEGESHSTTYPCRCGDYFVIKKAYLAENCLIECSQCSNCISIK